MKFRKHIKHRECGNSYGRRTCQVNLRTTRENKHNYRRLAERLDCSMAQAIDIAVWEALSKRSMGMNADEIKADNATHKNVNVADNDGPRKATDWLQHVPDAAKAADMPEPVMRKTEDLSKKTKMRAKMFSQDCLTYKPGATARLSEIERMYSVWCKVSKNKKLPDHVIAPEVFNILKSRKVSADTEEVEPVFHGVSIKPIAPQPDEIIQKLLQFSTHVDHFIKSLALAELRRTKSEK